MTLKILHFRFPSQPASLNHGLIILLKPGCSWSCLDTEDYSGRTNQTSNRVSHEQHRYWSYSKMQNYCLSWIFYTRSEIRSSHLSDSLTAGQSGGCISSGFPVLGHLIHEQHVAHWGNRSKTIEISPFTFASLFISSFLFQPAKDQYQFSILLDARGPIFLVL